MVRILVGSALGCVFGGVLAALLALVQQATAKPGVPSTFLQEFWSSYLLSGILNGGQLGAIAGVGAALVNAVERYTTLQMRRNVWRPSDDEDEWRGDR
jgi:hypothetical protein